MDMEGKQREERGSEKASQANSHEVEAGILPGGSRKELDKGNTEIEGRKKLPRAASRPSVRKLDPAFRGIFRCVQGTGGGLR